jgi:hypothetical protein
MNSNDTSTRDGNIPHVRKSGNPAKEAPKKMKRGDAHYIDTKLRETFIRGHAMNVHNKHMDLVRGNAQRNKQRKIP